MSPLLQFKLNARCLGRALVRGQWRKLPHFLRGVSRALYVPQRATVARLRRIRPSRVSALNRPAALRAG